MGTIRLSRAALDDFDRVISHLRDVSSRAVAAKYAEQIQAKINLLADFPGAGTPRPAFGDTTRVASVEPYLIFYDGGLAAEGCDEGQGYLLGKAQPQDAVLALLAGQAVERAA